MKNESPTSPSSFQTFVLPCSKELIWFESEGYGLLPWVEPGIYDAGYFAEYQRRDATEMGEKLTRARIEFVDRHHKGHHLIDIGIGGGRFVLDRPQTFGYDINPDAVRWLKEQSLYAEPWALFSVRVLTFWDSFEHIPDPSQLLARTDRVFMSIPIFESREHALSSKHYKPGEHVYYFTHDGLVRFMRNYGFTLVEANTMESDLGREGIESFYFRRT